MDDILGSQLSMKEIVGNGGEWLFLVDRHQLGFRSIRGVGEKRKSLRVFFVLIRGQKQQGMMDVADVDPFWEALASALLCAEITLGHRNLIEASCL